MSALQVFPKHPTADDTYFIGGAWAPACITAKDKRFTDAELAAEFWAATTDAELLRGQVGRVHASQKAFILHRFATLPHYDQERA